MTEIPEIREENIVLVPVDDSCPKYNTAHKNIGRLYVFVHSNFDSRKPERRGSRVDVDNINRCFKGALGFEVHVFLDLELEDIRRQIAIASEANHDEYDCVAIFILSHGHYGSISAFDQEYNPEEEIFDKFSSDKCPSLAGKPKLFFIQACQGNNLDPGIKCLPKLNRTQFDGNTYISYDNADDIYIYPAHTDFLIVYATNRNYRAIRCPEKGSYFVTILCQELEKYAFDRNILSILTNVNRRVALEVKSKAKDQELTNKKQSSYFVCAFTRELIFNKKN